MKKRVHRRQYKFDYKELIYGIILALLAILIVVAIVGFSSTCKNNLAVEGSQCTSDSDCVKMKTSCCSCNMGGSEKCVAKNSEDEKNYLSILDKCPASKDLFCAAVYRCEISSCKCNNGQCQDIIGISTK
jgi:hypothetical protein